MTITDTAKTFTDITVKLIDPDPENRTASIDADFVRSITAHGVVEPILVVPHPDTKGRYLLVAGERRWRAATKVGHNTIPAIVRTDLDEPARIEIQAIENIHRADLTPCQEAHQFMRLASIGHNVKILSAKVGRSQRYVRDRLRLAELPTKAQRLIDDGTWSIEDGLALTAMADQPDEIAALIETKPRNLAYAIQRRQAELDFASAAETLVAEAIKANITVIDAEAKHEQLAALDIDETAHRSEPCHAVILAGGGFRGEARLIAVCTKVANHRKAGKSPIKTSTKPGLSDTERKARADKKDSNQARHAAMAAILKAKISKSDAHALITDALIAKMSADDAKAISALLDLDVPVTNGNYRDHQGAVKRHAAKSATNRFTVATAIAMVSHDADYGNGWRFGQRWPQWLKARGWKPTAYDRDIIKKMKR